MQSIVHIKHFTFHFYYVIIIKRKRVFVHALTCIQSLFISHSLTVCMYLHGALIIHCSLGLLLLMPTIIVLIFMLKKNRLYSLIISHCANRLHVWTIKLYNFYSHDDSRNTAVRLHVTFFFRNNYL